MISYRDRTYCMAKSCNNKCGRKLTADVQYNADQVGLPISMGVFCHDGEPLMDSIGSRAVNDLANKIILLLMQPPTECIIYDEVKKVYGIPPTDICKDPTKWMTT